MSDTSPDINAPPRSLEQVHTVDEMAWPIDPRANAWLADPPAPWPPWQPIATAPRDGTKILLWRPTIDGGAYHLGQWSGAGHFQAWYPEPWQSDWTYWAPLRPPEPSP